MRYYHQQLWLANRFTLKTMVLRPLLHSKVPLTKCPLCSVCCFADPRSPVYTIWRKALKSTRQLGSASLELLLRLPRAYVRYPQKTE